MKTHLILGIAFIDANKSRRLTFQLIPDGQRAAIADIHFEAGIMTRCLATKGANKSAFMSECIDLASEQAEKSLEWAYPTSPNAESYGFKNSGCFVVKLGIPSKPSVAVLAFAANEEARALHYAQLIPFPWSRIALAVHPEYAQPVTV